MSSQFLAIKEQQLTLLTNTSRPAWHRNRKPKPPTSRGDSVPRINQSPQVKKHLSQNGYGFYTSLPMPSLRALSRRTERDRVTRPRIPRNSWLSLAESSSSQLFRALERQTSFRQVFWPYAFVEIVISPLACFSNCLPQLIDCLSVSWSRNQRAGRVLFIFNSNVPSPVPNLSST